VVYGTWFATNNRPPSPNSRCSQTSSRQPSATVVRGILFLPKTGTVPSRTVPTFCPSLLDIGGRKVFDLKPGANDVSRLSPACTLCGKNKRKPTHKPSGRS